MTLSEAVLLFLAAVAGGSLNAVAGGGSLLTFPTLLFLGVPAIPANATSSVALWPGTIASVGAYREDLRSARRHLLLFSASSFIGGVVGALLLLRTSPRTFQALVPWLILTATLVFTFGGAVIERLRRGRERSAHLSSRASRAAGFVAQLLIATYGGFFGGGMGIMMLATYTALGMEDIHAMNGIKNWCSVCINGVAVATFTAAGVVWWPQALLMVVGAVAGGYYAAVWARKVDPAHVRRFVIVLGFVLSGYFFVYG